MASQQRHRKLLDFSKPIRMLEFTNVETNTIYYPIGKGEWKLYLHLNLQNFQPPLSGLKVILALKIIFSPPSFSLPFKMRGERDSPEIVGIIQITQILTKT